MKYFLVGSITGKSLSDYRRALLIAYVILAGIGTCLYYTVVNLYRHYNTSLYFYYVFIGISLISFWLNRIGKHHIAKVIVLIFFNLVVFAFSSREPAVPAAFIFYIISSLVPLAVFDIKEKKSTVFFVLLSLMLYLVARFTTFSLVPSRPIDPDYLTRAYNNNLVIVYAFSVLIIYFLVRINYSVEASLQNREKQILENNSVLLKTNEELDRFIYSTSHDLRAPLNSIQGLINLSEICEDKKELAEYFKMMRERLFKLESVLNEIMEYSKNAKIEPERKEINLREYIDKALSDVQYMEGANRIKITIEAPSTIWILSDPMRISIILNNLISNSVKYSDLLKEDPWIIIQAFPLGEHVKIVVSDNGEGIVAKHKQKIFSMFYRATERSTGSGLGLYLVKETVEKLKGEITFTSEHGQGSVFTVTLPSA